MSMLAVNVAALQVRKIQEDVDKKRAELMEMKTDFEALLVYQELTL